MSTVKKSTRLGAASTEFNVGRETLVKYLTSKGFSITDSPASKVTEEMYDALQIEYGHNIAVKSRSAEINLPKGSDTGRGKKEDEPARSVKKAAVPPAPPAAKAEAPAKGATPVAKAAPAPVEEPGKPVLATEEKAPAKAAQPAAAQPEAPASATPTRPEAPETKPAQPEAAPAPAEPEIKAPEPVPAPAVEEKPQPAAPEQPAAAAAATPAAEQSTPPAATPIGPTVVGKIDLSDVPSDGRGKRGGTGTGGAKKAAPSRKSAAPAPAGSDKPATKKATPKKTKEEPAPVAESNPATATPATPTPVGAATDAATPATPATPVAEQPATPAEEPKVEHIEMKRVELEGPKILGKIELPVGDDRNNRGTRKRIPLNKKPETYRPSGTDLQNRAGFSNSNQQNAQQGNRAGMRPNRPGGPGGPGQPGGPGGEVDKKEIQRKIQETQARLSGGGQRGGRGKGAKYRRDKRDMRANQRAEAENNGQGNVINVTEFISVSDLASLMNVSFAEVISKCMSLGMMVSINQRLDKDVIELVANEFDYEVSFINLEQEADADADAVTDDPDSLLPRAPVVTIMGHVDHGKTSLLDYIRSANVVAGEAGGITQHIGAYQVTTEGGKKVTFLDTPGHEAFTAMRARGAKVADIAVIVIAADDAIMPQTKEAISHAQAANLPMIFAINKIDKEGANPEKIREQLSAMNILVEEWGGKFQSQEISAKKGLNVDLLLEKIGLEAELLELKANPDRNAVGSVIEASLDKGRGYVATMLVQSGTLEQGEMIVCGQHFGRVKAMLNERGQRVQTAGPSAPVQVLGLNGAPQAGEKFKMYEDEDEAKEIATKRAQILREQGIRARKHLTMEEIGRRIAVGNFKELPVIIKGDFDGSVEALSDALQKLSTEEVAVNVVHKAVGQITESDVLLATASDAIIIGFQVRPSIQANRLAEQESIEVRFYSIIYDAINDIKSAMEGLLAPKVEQKIVGHVEIREVYTITGAGIVAGCYVTDGKVERKSKLNLIRDGIVVFNGELGSLKRFKDDVKEVAQGYECGLQIKNYSNVKQGDIIEVYEEVEVKRTLGAPVA